MCIGTRRLLQTKALLSKVGEFALKICSAFTYDDQEGIGGPVRRKVVASADIVGAVHVLPATNSHEEKETGCTIDHTHADLQIITMSSKSLTLSLGKVCCRGRRLLIKRHKG